MGGFAWVTLATNDSYSLGALVLAYSLKQVGTTKQLAVLVTPGVTKPMREKLAQVFNVVQEVNILDSNDEANLRLLKRPELGVTFTKLHCWRLTQFDKCVFLDADTLVLQNSDELFEREELSAAPDVGWPDCFNSGVFVYRPSNDTFEKLVQLALEKGSFDGGDQGLLNLYFSDWATKDISKHLPFIYNMCSTACYSYLPAFKQFGGNAKILHFIGTSKPWLQYFNTETRKVQPSNDLRHLEVILQHWWNIFCNQIHPDLTNSMAPSTSDVTHSVSQSAPSNDSPPHIHTKTKVVWDPWDEYDQKLASSQSSPHIEPTSQALIQSHNTNANVVNEPPPQLPPLETYVPPPLYIAPPERQNVAPPQTDDLPHPGEQYHPQPPPPIEYTPPATPSHSHHTPETIISSTLESRQIPSPEPAINPDFNNLPAPKPVSTPAFVPSNECVAASSICEPILHKIEDEANSGLAGAFAQLTLGAPRTAQQVALDDHLRRQGWESGNIDYMGRDSFDNIWTKICQTLGVEAETAAQESPLATTHEPTPDTAAEAPQELPSLPVLESSPSCPLKSGPTSAVVETGSAQAADEPAPEAPVCIKPDTVVEVKANEPVEAPKTDLKTETPVEDTQNAVEEPKKAEQESPKPIEPPAKPAEESVKSAEAAPTPVEESAKPAEAAPKPVEESAKPAEAAPKSVEELAKPSEAAPKSVEESVKPAEAAPKSVEESAKPAESAPKPVEESAKSTEAAPKPVEETAKPTEVTPKPVEQAIKPAGEAPKAVEEAIKQAEAAPQPVNESAKPSEAAPKPVEPAAKSVEEAPKPVEVVSKSVQEPTKPVEDPSKTVEQPVKPVEEPPKPVEEVKVSAAAPKPVTDAPKSTEVQAPKPLEQPVQPAPVPPTPVQKPEKPVTPTKGDAKPAEAVPQQKPVEEAAKPAPKPSQPAPQKPTVEPAKEAAVEPAPKSEPAGKKPEPAKPAKGSKSKKPVEPEVPKTVAEQAAAAEPEAAKQPEPKREAEAVASPTPPPRKAGAGTKKTKSKK